MLLIEQHTSGALYLGESRCRFRIWAPYAKRVHVHLHTPEDRVLRLRAVENGYFEKIIDGVPPGALYTYRLDNSRERPDPASRRQPRGVHGPSEVVDPSFDWHDQAWRGLPLSQYIMYELHVGTFSPEGTFAGVESRLDHLVRLGITAVELMPVAACPGRRNWGYDGVYPFAVQENFGTPAELKRLVDACHQRGLAVILDVVYNHLGPEGNYLADFGPYFTRKYRTPWGDAINFDDANNHEVRRYFMANALRWLDEFHFDALRLDAIHAIYDESAEHFLKELGMAVHQRGQHLGRPAYLIAESNFNIPRITMTRAEGGDGLDAQWNDDFHYAMHARLTGERESHYRDFGGADQVTKTLAEGFVLTGQFSHYRGKHHGESSHFTPAERLVVSMQNHDQIGNRPFGERTGHLADPAVNRLATAVLMFSPYIPLLFMGEEYNDPAPFLFFTDHEDAGLNDRVRHGRIADYRRCRWTSDGFDAT
ncbi:MAG: malto-oligosyltrehalose trehalohydrolase, partial [Planctomycetota bacterium]|nr:malto-oligosyltrehalose trehalohydrolase [Planctomycetota bacterium]